jgi:hypothetical protein
MTDYKTELANSIAAEQDNAYNIDSTYYSNIFSNNWDYIWQKIKSTNGIIVFSILYDIDINTCYNLGVKGYKLLFDDLVTYLATKESDPNYSTYYEPLGQIVDLNFILALSSYINTTTTIRPIVNESIPTVIVIRLYPF